MGGGNALVGGLGMLRCTPGTASGHEPKIKLVEFQQWPGITIMTTIRLYTAHSREYGEYIVRVIFCVKGSINVTGRVPVTNKNRTEQSRFRARLEGEEERERGKATTGQGEARPWINSGGCVAYGDNMTGWAE